MLRRRCCRRRTSRNGAQSKRTVRGADKPSVSRGMAGLRGEIQRASLPSPLCSVSAGGGISYLGTVRTRRLTRHGGKRMQPTGERLNKAPRPGTSGPVSASTQRPHGMKSPAEPAQTPMQLIRRFATPKLELKFVTTFLS